MESMQSRHKKTQKAKAIVLYHVNKSESEEMLNE